MQFEWIQSQQVFEQRLSGLQSTLLVLDTEFVRVGTYRGHLGLIQLYDGNQLLLIDPFIIEDWQPLRDQLLSPRINFVLHACVEDLALLRDYCQAIPESILDTQVAAAFLGYGISVGFATLCQDLLNVDVCKAHSRTNWLQRPLTAQQLNYAAQDVYYLLPIYHQLRSRLIAKDWWSWVKEESNQLAQQHRIVAQPQQAWLKIGDAWRLQPRQLAVLRCLAAWREQQAQLLDVPLSRIATNASLMTLSQHFPDHLHDLQRAGLASVTIKKQGEYLITLIQQAADLPEAQWPKPVKNFYSRTYKKQYKMLKRIIHEVAVQTGIPEAVLGPKKILHEYLQWQQNEEETPLPLLIKGWRSEILAHRLS